MPKTAVARTDPPPLPLWEEAAAHRDKLLCWARNLTRNPEIVENAVQDTLLQAWRKGHTLRSREARWSWLRTTLRHQVLAAHRRTNGRERVVAMGCGDFEPVDGSQAILTANTERPSAPPACISSLPDHYQDILTSVYVEGMTIREFSESRGITLNNARVRLFRARKCARKEPAVKAPSPARKKPPPVTPPASATPENPDDGEWLRFAKAVATAFDEAGQFDTTTAEFTPRELRAWALSLLAATEGDAP